MAELQPVRGTHDLLPDEMRAHARVVEIAEGVASRYGFDRMATPIFEFAHVFKRTLGDTSDVVTKEMYEFTDRGGDDITLRPEGTAGAARAFLSNGLQQAVPLRWFYAGPMFRYERPQKGRLRQFHQIGVELIGAAQPLGDVEVIACGQAILNALGLEGKTTLELNTLGDTDSRNAYRAALVEYFTGHKAKLSEDSLNRLDKNPMRILDSKDEGDRALVADAPLFDDFLNETSRDFFRMVTDGLDAVGVVWSRNPRLVRGLDYYSHTAFEFTTTALGAQGTVMAGGRYDGLIGMMGGPATPGVGWAAGIERLSMLLAEPPSAPRPVAMVPVGAEAEMKALTLTEELRRAGIRVDLGYSGNVKKRMQRANKANATHAILIGEDEIAAGQATLRNLTDGGETRIAFAQLAAALKADLG